MSYFLFIDESGHDQHESPYEVLAGVAVEDRDLWNLINALQQTELALFGRRYSQGADELKARKLLKKKTFKHAGQAAPIESDTRRELARRALDDGEHATREQLTALAQAKIEFVRQVLLHCARFRCRVFASIVPRRAPRGEGSHFLRKDYAYLFERYFYFLEDMSPDAQGLVVFDELEKSQSHLLVDQMSRYFLRSRNGQARAGRIIPEPFFVHSDLTTGVQLADIVAYLIAWGVRVQNMAAPARPELNELAQQVLGLRHRAIREVDGNANFAIWSLAVIDDLRPQERPAGQ